MSPAIIYSDIPITDWIQAVGIIFGFPAALWSIIILFKKDKDRQIELESLSSLAQSQLKMIEKLSEQISTERARHLNSIMPFLNIIENQNNPAYLQRHAFIINLTNTGGKFKFKGFQWDYSVNVEFDYVTGIDQYIENAGIITIKGISEKEDVFLAGEFSVWLKLEDIEGNPYAQKLTKSTMRFFIEKPSLYCGSLVEYVQNSIRHAGTNYIH